MAICAVSKNKTSNFNFLWCFYQLRLSFFSVQRVGSPVPRTVVEFTHSCSRWWSVGRLLFCPAFTWKQEQNTLLRSVEKCEAGSAGDYWDPCVPRPAAHNGVTISPAPQFGGDATVSRTSVLSQSGAWSVPWAPEVGSKTGSICV